MTEQEEVAEMAAIERVLEELEPVVQAMKSPEYATRQKQPACKVEASPKGDIICPGCGKTFKLSDYEWDGSSHLLCGQRIKIANWADFAKPVWCLVGNIVAERSYGPGGREKRPGAKHFRPGAKVYCLPFGFGYPFYEKTMAVGYHRGSNRLVKIIIRTDWLENCRVKFIYSPAVLRLLRGWDASEESLEKAQSLANLVNSRRAETLKAQEPGESG